MLSGLLQIIRVLNMPCREHSVLISRMTDGEIPRAIRIGLKLHFVLCAPCRHFAAQLVFLKKAAARLGGDRADAALIGTRMPGEVRERLRAKFRNQRDLL